MKPLLAKTAVRFIDTILPPRCVLSGEMVDRQGMIAPQGWAKLDFIRTPHCDCCGFPFDFEVGEGALCAACLDYPPKYDGARAALKYDEGSRDLVLGFKHADKTHMARAFVPWMMEAGRDILAQADVLVPVPLHRLRLIKRRYNQAAILADYLGKASGVKVANDALLRIRATQSQGHLNTGERFKNVKKAFAVNPKRAGELKGKRIVLIDDVYTTGATVNECTKALRKSGATEVYVLTLCRVVRDGFG